MGLFDSPHIIHHNSIIDDPKIGFTSVGDWNLIDRCLIIQRVNEVGIRVVDQKEGGVKYAVDLSISKELNRKLISGRVKGASGSWAEPYFVAPMRCKGAL